MHQRPDPLNTVRIASPCPASWERMAGDERIRHCTLCDLNVYNFEAMTANEVRELILKTEGRLCARMYRRADGTLLTRDCPTGIQALRRRVSRFGSTVMSALLSVAALAGCATNRKTQFSNDGSPMTLEVERVAARQQAALDGIVVEEQSGVPLPGVEIVIRNEADGHELRAITGENGAFTIPSPSKGRYRIEAKMAGLNSVIQHVTLKQNEVTRARITMRIATIGEVITVSHVAPSPMETNEISTTFSEELINKLPVH